MQPLSSLLTAILLTATSVLSSPEHLAPVPAGFRVSFARDGHARMPFELRNQHVWLRGRVAGSDSVWVVIDTGASSSVLDDGLVRRLGLPAVAGPHAFGVGGMQASRQIGKFALELPGLSMRWPRLTSIDLEAIRAAGGRSMEVIVGYELFRNCVVRFDYAAGMVDVWDAARAPTKWAGTSIAMTLADNHPYVEAELIVPGRPPLRGRFVLDSGSSMALVLAPDVAARDSIAGAFPRTLVTLSRGVGGDVRNRVGRAESFALGDLRFAAPTVMLPESGAGYISVPGSLGNIGGQILGRCRVTFDYPNQRIHLEPGAGFDAPFEGDMSGATMVRSDDGLEVRFVNEATPASEAGLRVGDQVTQIDDEPAARVDPWQLRQLLRTEGRVVRLRLRRGEDSLVVTLNLRRIL